MHRVNVCSPCPVRTKSPAGMSSVCKAHCWRLSFIPCTCIRLCWAAFCIRRICIGMLWGTSHVGMLPHPHSPHASNSPTWKSNRNSAVCGRIETVIQGLPPPYVLNKPKFALVTSAETRNQIKAPNFGINWTVGSKQQVEVVNSLTGKTINGKVSRITKQAFFAKYAALIKRLPNIAVRSVRGDYGETKLAVKDYQVSGFYSVCCCC